MCASLESIFGMKSHMWIALPSSGWTNSSLKTDVCKHQQINNQNNMASKPKVYWLVMFSILIWLLKYLRKKCRYPSLNLWNPSPKSLNEKGIRVVRPRRCQLCQLVSRCEPRSRERYSFFILCYIVGQWSCFCNSWDIQNCLPSWIN